MLQTNKKDNKKIKYIALYCCMQNRKWTESLSTLLKGGAEE